MAGFVLLLYFTSKVYFWDGQSLSLYDAEMTCVSSNIIEPFHLPSPAMISLLVTVFNKVAAWHRDALYQKKIAFDSFKQVANLFTLFDIAFNFKALDLKIFVLIFSLKHFIKTFFESIWVKRWIALSQVDVVVQTWRFF